MKKVRELSAEEKGEMVNYLYDYGRADTVEQRERIRTLLFCYAELLLNKEKTR